MKKIVTVDGEVLTVDGEAVETDDDGTTTEYNIGAGLQFDAGTNTLSVNAASAVEEGNTNPVMSAAVWGLIGNLSDLTTTAKNNLVAAINEAAKTGSGGAGSINLRTADGYIQYSNDGGETWENLIALADLKGEKGDSGAPGPQGVPGEQGPQGETGPQGPQGETGPAGPQGKTGPAGPQGKTGPAGQDGAPGKDGSPGKDGTDGKDGTTFTPSVSAAGDLSWTNDGGKANPAPVNIKGPQGATGPQGPTGATGPQGAPGADYALTDADKTEIAAEAAAAIAGTSLPAPASAAVGQIVKIKAVDASGKITETEAVDMPTGGGGVDIWEIIADYTATEVASWITINKDTKGNSFSLKKVDVEILLPNAVSGGTWYLYLSPSTEFFGPFTIASQGSTPCKIRCTASSDDIVTLGLKRDKDYSNAIIGLDRKDSYKAITAVRLGNWADLTFPAGARVIVNGVRI